MIDQELHALQPIMRGQITEQDSVGIPPILEWTSGRRLSLVHSLPAGIESELLAFTRDEWVRVHMGTHQPYCLLLVSVLIGCYRSNNKYYDTPGACQIAEQDPSPCVWRGCTSIDVWARRSSWDVDHPSPDCVWSWGIDWPSYPCNTLSEMGTLHRIINWSIDRFKTNLDRITCIYVWRTVTSLLSSDPSREEVSILWSQHEYPCSHLNRALNLMRRRGRGHPILSGSAPPLAASN